MSDCRRKPPAELCTICHETNDGCTGCCRDSFIYDQSIPAEEIVQELRDNYVVGGKGGGLETSVKIPEHIVALLSEPEGPYAESARMIRRLRTACEFRAMMEGISAGKPLDYAGYTIEWDPYNPSPLKVSNHLNEKQHTYLEISPAGDISVSLAFPEQGDVHELLLAKGRDPVYTHDSSIPGDGFPEQTLLAWLEEATGVMNF